MKKAATTITDWRNRPRGGAVNDEVAKRNELHSQLERYVRDNGGWLTSAPGTKPFRVEAMHGSPLPARLQELGWQVRHLGTNTRILPAAVTETFVDHTAPGRPTVTRAFTGLAEVAVYELKP